LLDIFPGAADILMAMYNRNHIMMEYPYKKTSLISLKGERWKDIPGLDGYFCVSNLGRVKRNEYQVTYRNGYVHTKPSMIIKPVLAKNSNDFIGDLTYHLCVHVTLGGRKYGYTIPRLVYYCFVKPFDLKDTKILILTKNYDNKDIRPDNLVMATRGIRMQRAAARGRFDSPLLHMSEEARSKMLLNVARAQQKEVSQYSLSGKKIRTYESMAAASRELGLTEGVISKVANGKTVTAGGYIWRWGKEKKIDTQRFLADRRKAIRERNGSRITQYDFAGKRIAIFATATDAQEATGISASNCLKVVNGINKSAGGFYWKKGAGPAKIDLRRYDWGNQSGAIKRRKAVAQYDLSGKYIRTFTSVTAAAEHLDIGVIGISAACRGKQLTCKGYKWKFV